MPKPTTHYPKSKHMAGIEWCEESRKSKGGTEELNRELERRLPVELLKHFQIFSSRFCAPINKSKIPILWVHNMARDISNKHLQNDGWKRFHKIVFVSDHQMHDYIRFYKIPWSKCVVLQNAINPIAYHPKPKGPIQLIYTPTPNRGLTLLYPVFKQLCKAYDDIELSVFSSFDLYGWEGNDKHYEKLFNDMRKDPKVTYHGTVSNDTVKEHLQKSHIFAYPSVWQETSCLCLMEAMSAGLVCVHPRYGALAETAANWNILYPWHEDRKEHAKRFYSHLEVAISLVREGHSCLEEKLKEQSSYVSNFYNWESRALEWKNFLQNELQTDSFP